MLMELLVTFVLSFCIVHLSDDEMVELHRKGIQIFKEEWEVISKFYGGKKERD